MTTKPQQQQFHLKDGEENVNNRENTTSNFTHKDNDDENIAIGLTMEEDSTTNNITVTNVAASSTASNSAPASSPRRTMNSSNNYHYKPSWRPPTPPRPDSESSNKSSWFRSILPRSNNNVRNSSDEINMMKKSLFVKSTSPPPSSSPSLFHTTVACKKRTPPDHAFTNIPDEIKEAVSNESLLLYDESVVEKSKDMNINEGRNALSPIGMDTNTIRIEEEQNSKSVKESIISKFRTKKGAENNVGDDGTNGENNDITAANYHMMNDSSYNINTNNINTVKKRKNRSRRKHKNTEQEIQQKCDFFYTGIEELEAQRQTTSKWSMKQTPASVAYSKETSNGCSEYFKSPNSRHVYTAEYEMLNRNPDGLLLSKNSDTEDGFDDNDESYNNNYYDDGLDFISLFTFGCSPASRERELHRRGMTADNDELPAISDIRKSSLSYISNGRVQIRLPGDRVRLLMDDHMEAGILSVEVPQNIKRDHYQKLKSEKEWSNQTSPAHDNLDQSDNVDSNTLEIPLAPRDQEQSPLMANDQQEISSPLLLPKETNLSLKGKNIAQPPSADASAPLSDLNYVLTVDQDLYKRVLSEVVDSQTVCGFYYCCHDYESKNVNINVAIGILLVVFGLLFWGTCIWPTE